MRIITAAAADLHRFLRFPASIYAGDPCWAPAPWAWERRRMAAVMRRPGALVLLMALDGPPGGERVVGTISARRDSDFDADPARKVAWFGYLECVDDGDIAQALLEAAAAQARQWGAHVLRGPRNLTRFDFVGLTVTGHDRLPPMLQGQHPRRYQQHIEDAGFHKHHDVLAYETPLVLADGSPRPIPADFAAQAAACAIDGLRIRAARRWRATDDLLAVHTVLNEAYATVPDVSPMPQATFMGLGRAMLALAGHQLVQLAFVGPRPVGFVVSLPELNRALVACRGRIRPLRILHALRTERTAAFKLIGVVPELRGTGLHAALICAAAEGARAAGYRRVDGSVIDERNKPMRGVVEGLGMEVYRTYRLYERLL